MIIRTNVPLSAEELQRVADMLERTGTFIYRPHRPEQITEQELEEFHEVLDSLR